MKSSSQCGGTLAASAHVSGPGSESRLAQLRMARSASVPELGRPNVVTCAAAMAELSCAASHPYATAAGAAPAELEAFLKHSRMVAGSGKVGLGGAGGAASAARPGALRARAKRPASAAPQQARGASHISGHESAITGIWPGSRDS